MRKPIFQNGFATVDLPLTDTPRLGAFVLPKNTKRSHFIFEKGSGKLVEAKYGVKPADE